MSTEPRTIGDLGEFGVIERIRDWIAAAGLQGGPDVAVGTREGDDVAVVRPLPGTDLLLTCDVQIAGRHFLPDLMTPEEIGRRAIEVNLSDLAAKGGRPVWALVSAGLPPTFPLSDLEGIYRGLLAGLSEAGSTASRPALAGGNLASVPEPGPWFLDLTLAGAVPTGTAVLRSGARSGDRIFVSGRPGGAAAGLAVLADASLRAASRATDPWARELTELFIAPRARVGLGWALRESGLVTAMIDLSDGLLGDLFHVCEASGVRAHLDLAQLAPSDTMARAAEVLASQSPPPVSSVRDAAAWPTSPPWTWILGASDDYELLFTAPPAARDRIQRLATRVGIAVREIGEIRAIGEALAVGETRASGEASAAGDTRASDEASAVGEIRAIGEASAVGETRASDEAQRARASRDSAGPSVGAEAARPAIDWSGAALGLPDARDWCPYGPGRSSEAPSRGGWDHFRS